MGYILSQRFADSLLNWSTNNTYDVYPFGYALTSLEAAKVFQHNSSVTQPIALKSVERYTRPYKNTHDYHFYISLYGCETCLLTPSAIVSLNAYSNEGVCKFVVSFA